MKNNEKDVDFSLASDTDRLNFQSATDLNFPVEESSTIELTEHCDNVSKQSDQKVQDLIPSMTPDSNLLASRYAIPESLKNITSVAERYKDLIPFIASDSSLLGSRYAIPESLKNITSVAERYKGLIPSMASDSNLLASRYAIPESLKNITSVAERYKGLIPSMASDSNLLASRYAIPESLKNITSVAERYKGLIPSMASDSNLLASRYAIPESLKNITSVAERYKGLIPSMASDSNLLASRYAIPESLKNITSVAERYKGLIPSMASDSSLLGSRYAIPESLKNITSVAERYKGLIPSMASDSSLLGSRYAIPESLKNITSVAERYKGLIPSMASDSSLLGSRYTIPESLKNITSVAERYKNLMPASIRTLAFSFGTGKSNHSTLKELYNSVNNYLENISAYDFNSIIDVAKEYSSTSDGAAYIAINTTEFTSIEPDAITKLEEMKNKNGYIKKFRELPLPLQLIVYYIIMHIFSPIIEDTLKAEALELYTKASSVIIKSLPANSYIRGLISSNKENTDFEMLKKLRIITAHNVRLREKPSMKGEVIVFLDKYDVVSVLDKSNRKWLYVQVLIDGKYVNGWVNRTYTKNLNKV